MTRQERTAIDKLIEPAISAVAKPPYFRAREVVAEVLRRRDLTAVLVDLRRRYARWQIEDIVLRYIESAVSRGLQAKDSNGIRVWESYPADNGYGGRERRYGKFRHMDAATIRLVMRQTRDEARDLHTKVNVLQLFLDELTKLSPSATVEDVYDKVIQKVREMKGRH